MKNKDLNDRESGRKQEKEPGTKKLGDKIGPANNDRNRDQTLNGSTEEGNADDNDEKRNNKGSSYVRKNKSLPKKE